MAGKQLPPLPDGVCPDCKRAWDDHRYLPNLLADVKPVCPVKKEK